MGGFLSEPDLRQTKHTGETADLVYATVEMQGWRVEMEDAMIVLLDLKPGVHFFGVFDGHGGDAVALYVKKHLPTLLKQSRYLAQSNYEKVFEEVFRRIDTMLDSKTAQDELKELFKGGKQTEADKALAVNHASVSGCTACCAIITQDKIFVGNLGDSRAVLAVTPTDDRLKKD
jgi:protein phosphatase PTC2/3